MIGLVVFIGMQLILNTRSACSSEPASRTLRWSRRWPRIRRLFVGVFIRRLGAGWSWRRHVGVHRQTLTAGMGMEVMVLVSSSSSAASVLLAAASSDPSS